MCKIFDVSENVSYTACAISALNPKLNDYDNTATLRFWDRTEFLITQIS